MAWSRSSPKLVRAVYFRFRSDDIPMPVRDFGEASSTYFQRRERYGLGALAAIT